MPYFVGAAFVIVLIVTFAGLILWQEAKQSFHNTEMLAQNFAVQTEYADYWSASTRLVIVFSALMVLVTTAGARRMYLQTTESIQQQFNKYSVRILTASPVAMLMLDRNNVVIQANPAAKRLFGYPGDMLIGLSVQKLHLSYLDEQQVKPLPQVNSSVELVSESQYVRLDGTRFSALQSIAALPDLTGHVNHYIETVVDITDLKLAQERLKTLAETDKLTGLLNRHSGDNILFETAQRVRDLKSSDVTFAVIMGDIDHFKRVNDTFGHPEGDRVLVRIAAVLKEAIRVGDYCIRWGGEEFLIVLPGCPVAVASSLAQGMCLMIAEMDHQQVGTITMSFGVAEWREAENVETLIERVDHALYAAKHLGRNRVEISG